MAILAIGSETSSQPFSDFALGFDVGFVADAVGLGGGSASGLVAGGIPASGRGVAAVLVAGLVGTTFLTDTALLLYVSFFPSFVLIVRFLEASGAVVST